MTFSPELREQPLDPRAAINHPASLQGIRVEVPGVRDKVGPKAAKAGLDLYEMENIGAVLYRRRDPQDPTSELEPDPGQHMPNIVKQTVDQSAFFEAGGEIWVDALSSDKSIPESRLQELEAKIAGFWGGTGADAEFMDRAIHKGAAGHLYDKIVIGDDDEPTIEHVSSELVTREMDPHRKKLVIKYTMQYQVPSPARKNKHAMYREEHARNTVCPQGETHDAGVCWTITKSLNDVAGWAEKDFVQIPGTEADPNPIHWEYEFSAFGDVPNLRSPRKAYGVPDFINAVMQRTLHFSGSAINRILRYHASPKTIITGASVDQLDAAADSVWVVKSLDPKQKVEVKNLEMQSDLSSSEDWHDTLRQDTVSEGGGVDFRPDTIRGSGAATSGVALMLLLTALKAKVASKWKLWGPHIEDMSIRCLVITGDIEDYAKAKKGLLPIRFAAKRKDIFPKNRLEESGIIFRAVELGMLSRKTAAHLLDLVESWEDEVENIKSETDELGAVPTPGGAPNAAPGNATAPSDPAPKEEVLRQLEGIFQPSASASAAA